MDKKEIELAEKIKFWEEQEEINKILVSRIIQLENQPVDESFHKTTLKALKMSLWSLIVSFIALIGTLVIWVM